MDFAASSEGILMLRVCAAAVTAGSAAIATPQASRYLRFEAIIPLVHFTGLPARRLLQTQTRKARKPVAQGRIRVFRRPLPQRVRRTSPSPILAWAFKLRAMVWAKPTGSVALNRPARSEER